MNDIKRDLDLHDASKARLQAKAGAQKAYIDALKDEESFWKDKARMSWLSDGDHIIYLFHRVTRQQTVQGCIQLLQDKDRDIEDMADQLGSHVAYYSFIYRSDQPCVQMGQVDQIVH